MYENRDNYIRQRNEDLAGNINDYSIGDEVIDKDGSVCKITNKTSNTIEVFIRKKSKKGIDCTNWFFIKDFNMRFKKL